VRRVPAVSRTEGGQTHHRRSRSYTRRVSSRGLGRNSRYSNDPGDSAGIEEAGGNFIRELRPELPLDEVEIEIADCTSLAGGGSTPSQTLPTKLIRIASARYSATKLEQRLRRAPAGVSVIARVEDDRLILDLRTVFPEQEPLLIKTLSAAAPLTKPKDGILRPSPGRLGRSPPRRAHTNGLRSMASRW